MHSHYRIKYLRTLNTLRGNHIWTQFWKQSIFWKTLVWKNAIFKNAIFKLFAGAVSLPEFKADIHKKWKEKSEEQKRRELVKV